MKSSISLSLSLNWYLNTKQIQQKPYKPYLFHFNFSSSSITLFANVLGKFVNHFFEEHSCIKFILLFVFAIIWRMVRKFVSLFSYDELNHMVWFSPDLWLFAWLLFFSFLIYISRSITKFSSPHYIIIYICIHVTNW